MGVLYLTTGDFIKTGVPASVIAATVSCPFVKLCLKSMLTAVSGGSNSRLFAHEDYWVRYHYKPGSWNLLTFDFF